jgi:hypothetical protein
MGNAYNTQLVEEILASDEFAAELGGREQETRWHLRALPTTLSKLASISATTLARLLHSSQQRCKEVSSATHSGKSEGEGVSLHFPSHMTFDGLLRETIYQFGWQSSGRRPRLFAIGLYTR